MFSKSFPFAKVGAIDASKVKADAAKKALGGAIDASKARADAAKRALGLRQIHNKTGLDQISERDSEEWSDVGSSFESDDQ